MGRQTFRIAELEKINEELLEACKFAFKLIGNKACSPIPLSHNENLLFNVLETAIAKAEGRDIP